MLQYDKQNVTYGAFFKFASLLLTGSIIYVATLIPPTYGENCIIMSLFLMLSMAFAYVILLYVAYNRLDAQERLEGAKRKNCLIGFIYGTRMAIKSGILVFIVSAAARELVLRKYGEIAVALPVLLAALYIGSRGMGRVVRFAEAVFWFTVAAGVFVFAMSVKNIHLPELGAYTLFVEENGISCTINKVMIRGGLLFLGFTFMEMVIIIYMKVKHRRRGMLISVTGTAFIIGIIGSLIVITTLGMGALSSHSKDILYIVGAMELPGGVKMRPLMLVCYLLVVWGMVAIAPHIACAFDTMEENVTSHVRLYKLIWAVGAFGVCIILQKLYSSGVNIGTSAELSSVGITGMMGSSVNGLYRLIPEYLLLVDIPLSVILPVLAVSWKKRRRVCVGLLLCICGAYMCTGCAYKSIEDVDYASVLVIDRQDEQVGHNDRSDIGIDHRFKYSLVFPNPKEGDGKEGDGSDDAEKIYSVWANSFEKVRAQYNKEHARQLDTSHVEYIVTEDEEVLSAVCSELGDVFATSYVTVVIEENIIEKSGKNNTKEYLKTHYKGQCLAALDR